MSSHGIDVCLCGAVIAQCRCPGPHQRRVVRQKCDACREREVPPAATAQPSAPRRAEVSGGAQTPRERALLAINDGCLLGYDPPSAEEVVAALEAAGLRVVDAQEHDMTTRVASQLSLLRGLPLSVDVEEALHAAIRVVDQPRGECAVALMQTLRERLAPLRREDA